MLCNYECRWQNGRLFRFPREKKVIFIWVTRPGRQKGAKDEVKRPEARNRDPEGPQTSSIFIKKIPFDDFPKNQALKEPKPRLKSLLGKGQGWDLQQMHAQGVCCSNPDKKLPWMDRTNYHLCLLVQCKIIHILLLLRSCPCQPTLI